MCMCLRKSMYVYYFLKILPLPGTFLMNFTCTDSPASRIKTGFMVLSQCQFPNELYLKNINCADILLLNPSDSPKKNYFCYKSILPISIQDELGTPAPSSACAASLPPPSSSVSAGTKAEVTGQTEASCNPGMPPTGRTSLCPRVLRKLGEESGAPPATPKAEKAASPQGQATGESHRRAVLQGQPALGSPRLGDQVGLFGTPEGSSGEDCD